MCFLSSTIFLTGVYIECFPLQMNAFEKKKKETKSWIILPIQLVNYQNHE